MKQLIEEYLEDLEYRIEDLQFNNPSIEFIEGNKFAYETVIRELKDILIYHKIYHK